MAVVLVVFLCLFSVAAAGQIGPRCMQKDATNDAMLRCFDGLGRSNLINLDPMDKSGTLGQVSKLLEDKRMCLPSKQVALVKAISCFYDFYGNCLNIRKMLPTKVDARNGISYACRHVEEMDHPCLKGITQDMMVCYIKKVQERQIFLIQGKAKVKSLEDEACSYLKEELKCLKTALGKCPKPTATVFYTYMEMMMPNSCRYRTLMETLKHRTKLNELFENRFESRP